MDGEHFEPIAFEDEGMKKYLEIYQSQNFMLMAEVALKKARFMGHNESVRK